MCGRLDETIPGMTTVVGELDKVDLVTVDSYGRVHLVMTQVEQWDDANDQLLAIQSKVNNYLSFVLDGRLAQSHPDVDSARWLIRIDCQTQPTQRIAGFLDRITDAVAGTGGEFEVGVLSG
jgi:hypothetical protein